MQLPDVTQYITFWAFRGGLISNVPDQKGDIAIDDILFERGTCSKLQV